ncbi:uncharacterized protein METZ01_LOCUS273200, partial [marine metagenome]
SFSGGTLDANESLSWTGNWRQEADGVIGIAADKTLSYEGGNLDLGIHALEIKGAGDLELTGDQAALVLDDVESLLELSGNGRVRRVRVSATPSTGRGLQISGQPTLGALELLVDSSLSVQNQFSVDEGILVDGVTLTLNDSGTFDSAVLLNNGTLVVTEEQTFSGQLSQQGASTIKLEAEARLTTSTTQAVSLGTAVLSLEGPGAFANGQAFVLDQAGVGLELSDNVIVSGAVELGAGEFIAEDNVTLSGNLSLTADATLTVVGTLNYSGAEVSIGQRSLSLEGGGELFNTGALVLDDALSVVSLAGIGTLSSMRVDADSGAGQGLLVSESVKVLALEVNQQVELLIEENVELSGSLSLNAGSVLSPSGLGILASDVILAGGRLSISDTRSLPGTLSLSSDSEIEVKTTGDLTLAQSGGLGVGS